MYLNSIYKFPGSVGGAKRQQFEIGNTWSKSLLRNQLGVGTVARKVGYPEALSLKIGDSFLIFRLISSSVYLLYAVRRTLSYIIHY